MEIRSQKPEARSQKSGARSFGFPLQGSGVLIALVLSLFTFRAQGQVLSLDSILKKIDHEHPMLQEYDEKAKALNAYAEGATAWMAPMVGVGTFMKPYPGQEQFVPHGMERDKGSVMVSVEQSIPNPARLRANRNYLDARAAVEQQGRSLQYNTLRAEAKTFYYQWLVLEQKMNVLKENERIIEFMIKLARIRYPYNQGSLGNIYKAEGRLQEVQNMMLMTEGEIEEKKSRLRSLASLAPETPITIDTTQTIVFAPQQVMTDTAILRQRSDVKQIDQTIEVMRLNQRLQQYQAKPDFRIRFDHMDPINNMPKQFTAMAMISIPIAPWSSKMYKAEVKGMQYDIESMKRNREGILQETKGMLAGMGARIVRMQQQLTNYETKIIPALRKNYETLVLAYEENREQLPMILDGWEALSMAQLEFLDKREEYFTMIVNYEKEIEK